MPCHAGVAAHGLSRDHGRTGQDAASEDPRRPARPPRHRRCSHAPARHRADRPRRRQSLSVRGDGREARTARTRTRSRTSTSAGRRWCAPRRRITNASRWSSIRSTTRPCLPKMNDAAAALSEETRKRLAAKAFAHTAGYDAAVASYLGRVTQSAAAEYPESLALNFRKRLDLRYGENPHQTGAFYCGRRCAGRQHRRRAAAAGQDAVLQQHRRRRHGVRMRAAVRRTLPASSSSTQIPAASPSQATRSRRTTSAYRTDPTSAFGGIIAFNRPLDAATARAIVERQFVELIIAPDVDADALEICARKENVRVLATGPHCAHASAPRIPQRQRRPAGADAR